MNSEKKIEYLKVITQLFMKYGFKSIGVDDIARELGISKKTLYQEFKDKNDIVEQVISDLVGKEQQETCEISDNSVNAIDEIIHISKKIGGKYQETQPSIVYELQKYYPSAWKIFQNHKTNHVFKRIKANLDRGMAEGLYRNNLKTGIIATLFVNKMELFLDGDAFGEKKYSFQEIYFEMMRYHIRGIASEKGREYLKTRIQQEQIDL